MGQRKSALRRGWIAGMIVLTIGMTGGCAMGRKAEQETLRMSGIEKLEAGDYTGAIADLEAALNLGKGRVSAVELDILKYRAEAEYKAGDYGAAAHTYEVLRQVEGEKPEYARLHCLLSIQAGNVEQALADYQETYKEYLSTEAGKADEAVKEEMMGLLKDMGKALENAGQTDTALELYTQAETDGLADSVIYNQKGLCYLSRGDYLAAGQAFETGLSAPDGAAKADLSFNYAVALEYQGEYAKALEAFESYVAQFGADDQAEHEIAFLRTR